ncbi:RHS repeat domain-containing protein [Flavobacterium kingsejongi]|uniref:YD repeat-containing protein n=1 Tax=Flavobacterium kingsejongi TaxID=1678728 RepID=A0A2S1LL80_9FLAO|nr:RHS repeat domain-containing protein [Flavobacterium kingsejongi]AWG24520.1 hypothetical protein FK004_04345 [Flavobacterium kingsejongi]
MKKIYLIALLLVGGGAFSQLGNPGEIRSELPQVIPPSPTVTALMRFEEMPVSHYTGIPDVSVPLYNIPTHSKDISIDISLKYHPSGIRTEEVAGYNGQGWALSGAGGTISRTVKGLPDEYLSYGTADGTGPRVGIYNIFAATYPNRYYTVMSLLDVVAIPGDNTLSKFLWEAHEKGIFDTEHDLYQYSFQNYNGRFFIKKDGGSATVVPLDNNPVKIVYNEGSGFTIYDDKGYRYMFTVPEETRTVTNIKNQLFVGNSETLGTPMTYISAYQLSAIYDTNARLLASYVYEDFEENAKMTSIVHSRISDVDRLVVNNILANGPCQQLINAIEPTQSIQITLNKTITKKIKQIQIVDKGSLQFTTAIGRSDTNIENPGLAAKLNTIVLTDWYGSTIKTTSFEYALESRMKLKKVIVGTGSGTLKETTEFFYKRTQVTGKDYWGYPNYQVSCKYNADGNREVNKNYIGNDVLQKIAYPTGGCVIFDYESNTYSHVGNQYLEDFNANPDNRGVLNLGEVALSSAIGQNVLDLGYFPNSLRYSFDSGVTTGGVVRLIKKNSAGTVAGTTNLAGLTCDTEIILEGGYYYSLQLSWFDSNSPGGATIGMKSYYDINPKKEWLYGGGIRIKRIGHFTADVPQGYYSLSVNQQLPYQPLLAKEKNYSYQFPDRTNRSSGSLVFIKPVFHYSISKRHGIRYCGENGIPVVNQQQFQYDVYTDFNNLSFIKTQGAEVGYQFVTVGESGNGKTVYSFTSPIDYPEDDEAYDTSYPFLPSTNFDYKRGLTTSERVYDNSSLAGRLLSESVSNYTFEEKIETTGLRLFSNNNCGYSKRFANYASYENLMNLCIANPSSTDCRFNCGPVLDFVQYYKLLAAFGWAKLSHKTTKNYYENTGPIETIEEYAYNSVNKRIASHKTITNSNPLEFKQNEYSYATFPNNKIAEISDIKSYDQNGLLSASRLNYSGSYPSNAAYLPASVDVSKGNEVLQPRLNYNGYDEFSNVLEVQLQDGIQTSYIWGYNKTQVIAKIENIGYANINAGLITAAQNASNTAGATGLEAALTNLCNSLPNAMVTTYTYKPMVGVSTVTDPKGDKVSYIYDAFGRLSSVKDKNGYILSLNNYNYRTQN